MSVIDKNEQLGFADPTDERLFVLGRDLANYREELKKHLAVDDNDPYNGILPKYLNCIQEYWFEQNNKLRYEAISELDTKIACELKLLFDLSITTPETVKDKISGYLNDETSQVLKNRGISPYPRVTTLVMLDMIDNHR